MKVLLIFLTVLIFSSVAAQTGDADRSFERFKERFMDAYWKQYPSYSILIGYGKYYEDLAMPGESYFKAAVSFSNAWLDSLEKISYDKLNANNKTSHDILKNQLRSDIWGIEVFKVQQWDPSIYNLGNECYTLLTEPFASLDIRLKTLSTHLQFADVYYKGAFKMLLRPTREHTRLSIQQNEGALQIFGAMLTDSINSSGLSVPEKDTLQQRIKLTVDAIKEYVAALQKISADSNYSFRSFRIGEKLFNQKFKNDIVSDYTANEIFKKANEAKEYYHREMYLYANKLWAKYCGSVVKPADSLLLVKTVIDSISLYHVSPKDFFDTLNKQVKDLKRFVVEKDLFDFDTSATLIVRNARFCRWCKHCFC